MCNGYKPKKLKKESVQNFLNRLFSFYGLTSVLIAEVFLLGDAMRDFLCVVRNENQRHVSSFAVLLDDVFYYMFFTNVYAVHWLVEYHKLGLFHKHASK